MLEKIEFNEGNFEFLKRRIKILEEEIKIYKYDYLTGLLGRIDFNRIFDDYFHDWQLNNHSFLLCLIDINDLHIINRSKGYVAGDNLILNIVKKIQYICPNINFYRIGGDEFAILIKNDEKEELISKLNTIENITFSLGIPVEKESQSDFFKRIDNGVIERKKLKHGKKVKEQCRNCNFKINSVMKEMNNSNK